MPRAKKTQITTDTEPVVITAKEVKKTVTKKTEPVKKPNKKVPLDELVPVASNCMTPLIYVSSRQNGYKVEWENYGDVDYITVAELIAMRGSARRFFTDNWIVIQDGDYTADEVYERIGVTKLYEDVVTPETIKDLFNESTTVISKKMAKMSDGLKRTVYNYAVKLKDDGEFDSIKKFELIKSIAGFGDLE